MCGVDMSRSIPLTMVYILTKLLFMLRTLLNQCIQKSTQTIEGIWMQAKQQVLLPIHGLFPSYLPAFQWRNSHKVHVFGQSLGLLSDNYNILVFCVLVCRLAA